MLDIDIFIKFGVFDVFLNSYLIEIFNWCEEGLSDRFGEGGFFMIFCGIEVKFVVLNVG